jgi:cellulose synthase/poly-beta-1,6-N-acetylglucosamine synthase-like glycosyltransferase
MNASIFFLLGAGFAFLALAQHPFISYPWSLRLMLRFRNQPLRLDARQETDARFAICVCAYNEEAVIRQKIENLLELRRQLGALEILIYVDGAVDKTSEILEAFREALTLVIGQNRAGKSAGMNTLVRMAKAPLVIFSDANVIIDPASIRNLRKYFTDPTVGCACGYLTYVNAGASSTAQAGSAYWSLEERIKQLESDTGSVMGADGSIFAIRRDLFQPIPPDIIDDMYTSLAILCSGWRVVRAPDVRAYEEQAVAPGDEFKRRIRIGCQAFNVHRLLWPKLRKLGPLELYKYLSHRWLKWVTGFNLAIAAICFAAALLLALGTPATAIVLALGLIAVIALRFVRPRLFGLGIAILSAVAGTALGVVKSLRGERFQTWTPPASSRGRRG